MTQPHTPAAGEAIGLVVRFPFATPEEFLAKYGANITRGGIYLRSKTVKPPGSAVTLDLKLADGSRIIHALAVVHFVTGQAGLGISGMGFRFLTVDPATQQFLDSAVAVLPHAQSALPPLPAGVGPADDTVPPGVQPVAVAEAPTVAPALTPAPGQEFLIPAHTPWPGTIPVVTQRPAHTPHPGALPVTQAAPAHTPHPGTLPTEPSVPAQTPHPGALPAAQRPAQTPHPEASAHVSQQPAQTPHPEVSAHVSQQPTHTPHAETAPATQPPAPTPPETTPAAQPPAHTPVEVPVAVVPRAPAVASGRPAPPPEPTPTLTATPTPLVPSAPPFEPPAEEPKRTGPIIGIDLGTSNSCAAYVRNTKPSVLPSREGHNTVPSIIALNTRGRLVVGHPAKGQMLTNPRQTVYGAKRLVGRPYESPIVRQIKDRFVYEIAPGENGEAAVRLGDRIYTLQQLSALILREVKEVAQNQLGQSVSRAVITVPAYYNDNQRQAVREAGRLAGLHVERILNEPTAAALAYGFGRKLKQRVLVYDLGGGTFDASVLELNDTVYEVVSTGGDTFLGGIDFDNAIVEYLLEQFHQQTGHTFQGDRVAMQRIHDAAERAKCALSERSQVRVHVAFLTMIAGKPVDLDVNLTREKLIELTEKLVNRTLEVCADVLDAKGLTPKDIDEIILVGGQSRFPLVHEKISWFFGKAPTKNVHPDEAVALGAALLAHSLGENDGVVLIDVLPMAIGVGLPGGRFKPVLERNAPLPANKSYQIATSRDDQQELDLIILQGDSERAVENEYLGTLKVSGLPSGPRGSIKVSVTFEVNNECILKVTAREQTSGLEVMSIFSTRDTPEEVKSKLGLNHPHLELPAARPLQPPAPARPQLGGPGAPLTQKPTATPPVPLPIAMTARDVAPGGLVGWLKRILGRT
ncbi:TIGR02266 family protein [Vitiosangium sp. GDMCC 1.1324]|uniref:TIGR02266 family protein n=1 Tax=Vitiosangium sp. (strain GDMCC 1.1324) TaxID=2138576 RepID=UPI001E2F1F18|nr:TIGR02266 family protein [Vitiosangium sp. GDMCC 1.1324]